MNQDRFSQIEPLNIEQLYWNVKNIHAEGGWKVGSEISRVYYREPVSTKFAGVDNMSFETITYEVMKRFNNKNYIHASISMKFSIVSFGEPKEKEDYKCMLVCADALQKHIDAITKGHEYLGVDVSVNSDTKFEEVPPDKLGTPRLN